MKKYVIYCIDAKVYYAKCTYHINNWHEDVFFSTTYENYEAAENIIKTLPQGIYEIKVFYMNL